MYPPLHEHSKVIRVIDHQFKLFAGVGSSGTRSYRKCARRSEKFLKFMKWKLWIQMRHIDGEHFYKHLLEVKFEGKISVIWSMPQSIKIWSANGSTSVPRETDPRTTQFWTISRPAGGAKQIRTDRIMWKWEGGLTRRAKIGSKLTKTNCFGMRLRMAEEERGKRIKVIGTMIGLIRRRVSHAQYEHSWIRPHCPCVRCLALSDTENSWSRRWNCNGW